MLLEYQKHQGPIITLQSDEFITSISGMAGSFVNQIHFKTTKGQDYIWPQSPQGTGSFSTWTMQANQVLIGFQGRSGSYLDHLEPIVCTFSEANCVKNY